jgi:hypothetical protein
VPAAERPSLTVAATKPRGRVAKMLHDRGVRVVPTLEDEGNVERYVISKRVVIERRSGGERSGPHRAGALRSDRSARSRRDGRGNIR